MSEVMEQVAGSGGTQLDIDRRVFDLYDEDCHGRIDRREFLRLAALGAGGPATASGPLPRDTRAQTNPFTDPRIKAEDRAHPPPRGNTRRMPGCLGQPA